MIDSVKFKEKYKPYEPTMPKRKLKNLILITDKNIGKVKGDINRFLKKPCVLLEGFSPKVIGRETIQCCGKSIERNTYSAGMYPCYYPYLSGSCYIHPLRKKYIEEGLSDYSNEDDIPRLAIGSKFRDTCIPINIGDRYKIFGNRLVIMHKWDKYFHNTPWLRFDELIQVNSHDPDEVTAEKISAALTFIFADSFYLSECIRFILSDPEDRAHFKEIYNECYKYISLFVENVLRCKSINKINSTFKCEINGIGFYINPVQFLKDGCYSKFYWFDGESKDFQVTNLTDALEAVYKDWITASNDNYEKKQKKYNFEEPYFEPWWRI